MIALFNFKMISERMDIKFTSSMDITAERCVSLSLELNVEIDKRIDQAVGIVLIRVISKLTKFVNLLP